MLQYGYTRFATLMISLPKQVWSKMLSSTCAHVEVFATFLGRKLYFSFSMPATNGMRTNFPTFSRHFLMGRSKHLSINGSVHMWVKLFWPIIKDDPIQQVLVWKIYWVMSQILKHDFLQQAIFWFCLTSICGISRNLNVLHFQHSPLSLSRSNGPQSSTSIHFFLFVHFRFFVKHPCFKRSYKEGLRNEGEHGFHEKEEKYQFREM